MESNQQWGLWEFIHGENNQKRDEKNKLGPYELSEGQPIPRHLGCVNYDSCLSYAARNRWSSFSCLGCRFTEGGTFKGVEVQDVKR